MTWRRLLVGFGLTTLALTLTLFFSSDWPFFGRTAPGEVPCFSDSDYPANVPKDHYLDFVSDETVRFPPGVRCHWRECVARENGDGCKSLVDTRSRRVPAKAEAYLLLVGGSAGTAVVIALFAVLWLIVFLGPRGFVRALRA